jgi:cobalt/nickel transport system permease protein
MHIPDGFMSAPVNVASAAVSIGAVGYALARAKTTLEEKQIPLLGVTAAFIFAAQMLNFPVAAGTSGHFMGAALAAVLLGPLNAVIAMTLVVVLQCLLFGDGGLTALGTNVFNMAILGSFVGWGGFRLIHSFLPKGKPSFLLAAGIAAWISIVIASSVCALQLAFSGTSPLMIALPAMAGMHAVIGVGEALITMAILSTVLVSRPDLISSQGVAR